MKLKSLAMGTTLAVAALSASGVMAYEAGDVIVRAGIVNVSPDESSDAINVVGVPSVGKVAGSEAEVDSDTQLGLTATYMLNSDMGIELLAATPFTHDITANLGGGVSVDAGETSHLPPTLSLVWYPMGSAGSISPYVGAGLNYTAFFEEEASGKVEALAGSLAGLNRPLPMGLELDDSWGVAAQIGVDFAIDEQWHVNASVRWIDIDTDATFKTSDSSILPKDTKIITVNNVEIDPWVYQLNIGYTF